MIKLTCENCGKKSVSVKFTGPKASVSESPYAVRHVRQIMQNSGHPYVAAAIQAISLFNSAARLIDSRLDFRCDSCGHSRSFHL